MIDGYAERFDNFYLLKRLSISLARKDFKQKNSAMLLKLRFRQHPQRRLFAH